MGRRSNGGKAMSDTGKIYQLLIAQQYKLFDEIYGRIFADTGVGPLEVKPTDRGSDLVAEQAEAQGPGADGISCVDDDIVGLVRVGVDPALSYDHHAQAYRVELIDGAVQFIRHAPEKTAAAMTMLAQAQAAGLNEVANQLRKYLVDLAALSTMPAMVVARDAALIYKKSHEWTDAEWKLHYSRPRGKGKPAESAMVGWTPFREGA